MYLLLFWNYFERCLKYLARYDSLKNLFKFLRFWLLLRKSQKKGNILKSFIYQINIKNKNGLFWGRLLAKKKKLFPYGIVIAKTKRKVKNKKKVVKMIRYDRSDIWKEIYAHVSIRKWVAFTICAYSNINISFYAFACLHFGVAEIL